MTTLSPELFEIVGSDAFESNVISRPMITYWQDAWRRLKKKPIAMIALFILIIMIILCIIGPYIRGFDLFLMDVKNKNLPPDATYWFGTDNLGRDLFSRIWLGSRASILVAIVCTTIQIVLGSIVGGVMAYLGGWVDELLMRIIEILSSIPSLLLTMLIMIIFGNGYISLLIALSAVSWTGAARQVRGQILQLREMEYVTAAEALGSRPRWMILKHLLPNTMGILILIAATSIPSFIFMEAGLSFLGIGLQPPNMSLGVLISLGQQNLTFHPYQLYYPALVLCIIVLCFNLLGDGLRDALDPKLRQ